MKTGMEPASNVPGAEQPMLEQGREAEREKPRASAVPSAVPHPWDGYMTGPENELAMAAAQALARGEREGISPLWVYGPSGVGKSRLLAGLVAERLRRHAGSAVAHLDAEAFAAACAEAAGAASGGGWSALRGRFRSVDLFVLEDLDGLERAPLACSELVHTLDALEDAGAGVAVSARAAPGASVRLGWPARLVARLLGGLAVRIAPPGLAGRRRYVLERARQDSLVLEAGAVETLAQAADGYRTLDGWIARIALEARLERKPEGRGGTGIQGARRDGQRPPSHPRRSPGALNLQAVEAILAEEAVLAAPLVTTDAIARAVASQFSVPLGVLRGKSRRASVVTARHLAMHLARAFTGSSFAAIGTYFGGRDAGTVRHACEAAALRLNSDPSLAAAAAALSQCWQKADA
jgi:chromosomal replication initiator protein